jgi:drug/metabolite transporter (DMT)-like permease
MEMIQKANELYNKRKMKIAIFGLTLAFVAAMCNTIFQNFSVAASGIIREGFASTLLAAYVLSVLTLGICELIGGLITVGFNSSRGVPLAEYGRVWGVKSSRTILLSAILGGPVATAAAVMAIALAGSTYANCVIGLTPVVTAIFGILFLKEKAGVRVWSGIVICTAGVILATLSPPEGVTNFYLEIAIVAICPIAYTLESIISTHAIDVSDPMLACPLVFPIKQHNIRTVVVFPAPFGPRKPKTSPLSTCNVTLSTAVKLPNFRVRSLRSIMLFSSAR